MFKAYPLPTEPITSLELIELFQSTVDPALTQPISLLDSLPSAYLLAPLQALDPTDPKLQRLYRLLKTMGHRFSKGHHIKVYSSVPYKRHPDILAIEYCPQTQSIETIPVDLRGLHILRIGSMVTTFTRQRIILHDYFSRLSTHPASDEMAELVPFGPPHQFSPADNAHIRVVFALFIGKVPNDGVWKDLEGEGEVSGERRQRRDVVEEGTRAKADQFWADLWEFEGVKVSLSYVP
jgi:hypothetical protein